jgi:hypothetical protein
MDSKKLVNALMLTVTVLLIGQVVSTTFVVRELRRAPDVDFSLIRFGESIEKLRVQVEDLTKAATNQSAVAAVARPACTSTLLPASDLREVLYELRETQKTVLSVCR